jgi:hypothetical protein
LQSLSLHKLRENLFLSGLKHVPSAGLLSRMLRKEFALSYRHFDSARIRFN